MDFKTTYPDFAPIEQYIRRAHEERSVYLAHAIASFIASVTRGLKRVADTLGTGLDAEHERQIIESDAFLKRSVPRY